MTFHRLAAVAALGLMLAGPAAAQSAGDPVAGEASFRKCATCHAVGENARNRLGPQLNGVVGRQAGTGEGFSYSPAMKAAGEEGLMWTPEHLAEYLRDPRAKVPGNKMAFVGIKDQAELDNVIAYLMTFSPDYVPAAPAQ